MRLALLRQMKCKVRVFKEAADLPHKCGGIVSDERNRIVSWN
jgi:hypothetical protein|tara:strand:- start:524 stop:649 length:126 start_codon:yes stop_codon:yes gene_type:complete